MSDFDLEQRIKTNVEETVSSLRLQWNSPTYDGKYLLLVEHDCDKRCYYRHFNPAYVEIKTTMGCNNMRRLFLAIQPLKIPNFAIQDSDFARVCGCVPTEPNYFITDCHDHEMMCLSNNDVLRDLFSIFAIDYDATLVDEIFDDLTILTNFKWYNYYYHLNVNFRGLKLRGRKRTELRSFDFIYREVLSHSPGCTKAVSAEDIYNFVSNQAPQNQFELTNGHDFLDLMSQGFEERYKEKNICREKLQPIIYACFTSERFKKTQLYYDIRSWAGENADNLLVA